MTRRLAAVLVVVALLGCGPRPLHRAEIGAAEDAGPLAQRLQEYNAGPQAVRVQGRLQLAGRGSAVFAARADAGRGVRLDLVSGAFARPLLALACGIGGDCRVYLPERQTVYLERDGTWGAWLTSLLRGRVPVLGAPLAAWRSGDEVRVLSLEGEGGWWQDVEFDVPSGLPRRVLFSRRQQPQVELLYEGYSVVEGHSFPGVLTVRVQETARTYRFEFGRVQTESGASDTIRLNVPPGTTTEVVEGSANWSRLGIPLWLPSPMR